MFKLDEWIKCSMSGLENLEARLNYRGGAAAQDRMIKDKLQTLRKALLYSYQAETAVLPDGREFRCLINNNKLSTDYDEKIISIPFEDICLNSKRVGKTSEGIVPTNIAAGQVFEWKRTNTFWIIYLQHLEESAYFRGSIRECNGEAEIGDKKYKVYLRGPAETELQWNQKSNISWNDINYSLVVYITKNEETEQFFHRFTKVKIDGKMWEVAVVNSYYGNGIIKVCLNEYYNNEMEEKQQKDNIPEIDTSKPYIRGDLKVHPYDIITYDIEGMDGGQWFIDNKKAKIVNIDGNSVIVEVLTGKSGEFNLTYKKEDKEVKQLIKIVSL